MKRMLTVAVLSTLGVGAMTAQAAEFADTAQVISATPIYDRVSSPRRECVNEPVTTYEDRRIRRDVPDAYRENRDYRSSSTEREGTGAGAVLGAIIGGVIGHQFGNSSGGRDRGTAAGAILGGVIGNQIEKDSGNDYRTSDSPYRRSRYDVERVPVTRDVQRCNVVNDYREEIRGYDVRYRYNGRDYTTRVVRSGPDHPGASGGASGQPRRLSLQHLRQSLLLIRRPELPAVITRRWKQRRFFYSAKANSTASAGTSSFSLNRTSLTSPSLGLTMVCSIFMASRMMSGCSSRPCPPRLP